jgi:site-specific DNA-methyltransferase (adenine-specific)
MVLKNDPDALRTWPDVTEVCGFYQREPSEVDLWNTRGESHPVRLYLAAALAASGLSLKDVDARLGVSDMARHWFTWSQWCIPSEERYRQLQIILPGLERSHESLKAEAADVWQQHREDWEALRAPFTLPTGVTNVWCDPVPQGGVRLEHPCQKPLSAVRRAILASTRPGDLVCDPFGGTLRVALACEQLHADQARRHISIEMDPAHVEAALKDIDIRTRQHPLF